MSKKGFENIIKDKFSGAESEVPAGAWSAVSSGLGAPASSVGFFSSVLGKVAAALVLTGVLITTVSLFVLENNQKPETVDQILPSVLKIEEESVSESLLDAQPLSSSEEPKQEPNVKSEIKNSTTDISPVSTLSLDKSTAGSAEDVKNLNSVSLDGLLSEPTSNATSETITEKALETSDKSVQSVESIKESIVLLPTKIASIKTENSENNVAYSTDNYNANSNYRWYINDELISENGSFNHRYAADGEYTIMTRIFTNGELTKTLFLTEQIRLDPELFVPNTFTPQSSGGFNDYFDIDHGLSKNVYWYEIYIFSPSGAVVFKSDEQTKKWNGLDLNGNLSSEGAYAYVINYKSKSSKTLSKKGKVILQR